MMTPTGGTRVFLAQSGRSYRPSCRCVGATGLVGVERAHTLKGLVAPAKAYLEVPIEPLQWGAVAEKMGSRAAELADSQD